MWCTDWYLHFSRSKRKLFKPWVKKIFTLLILSPSSMKHITRVQSITIIVFWNISRTYIHYRPKSKDPGLKAARTHTFLANIVCIDMEDYFVFFLTLLQHPRRYIYPSCPHYDLLISLHVLGESVHSGAHVGGDIPPHCHDLPHPASNRQWSHCCL